MRDVLRELLDWWSAGKTVGVATVVATFRSAPRPPGASMLVGPDGSAVGSVSGGCVEGDVITEAMEAISDGRPRTLEFGVADETAWRAGLSCGGRIRVFVERLD